tara:strand:- start:441 stop:1064 length:624 start_codon:yes stop_codon:yes gene_type:complete
MSLKFNLTTGNLDSTSASFGSQNVETTGQGKFNSVMLTTPFPAVYFNDTDTDADDFRVVNANGTFKVQESTGGVITDRVTVDSNGAVNVPGDVTSNGTMSVLTAANPQLKLIDSSGDPDSFATITYNNGNDSDDVLIINVDAGNSTTGHQPNSHIRFYVDGNQEARIDANGLKVYGSQIDFTGIPTSDPNVAGRLWRDGTDLKISVG